MNRDYFLQTKRIGFSKWTDADLPLARQLWGDPDVTRLICASGRFTPQEIADRLVREIDHDRRFSVQYWPVFELNGGGFMGCGLIKAVNVLMNWVFICGSDTGGWGTPQRGQRR